MESPAPRIYNVPAYGEDVVLLKSGTLDNTRWLRRRQPWVELPGDIETVD